MSKASFKEIKPNAGPLLRMSFESARVFIWIDLDDVYTFLPEEAASLGLHLMQGSPLRLRHEDVFGNILLLHMQPARVVLKIKRPGLLPVVWDFSLERARNLGEKLDDLARMAGYRFGSFDLETVLIKDVTPGAARP